MSVHIFHPLLDGFVCLFSYKSVLLFVDLDISPLSDGYIAKIFFSFCWLLVHSNDCFFCCTEALEFNWVLFIYFDFVANAFGVLVMKSLPMSMSIMVLPRFSSRVFMVLGLMFKSLIHLEFILV